MLIFIVFGDLLRPKKSAKMSHFVKSQQIFESEIFAGGCVLDMGKTMGRVPRLETAENHEF